MRPSYRLQPTQTFATWQAGQTKAVEQSIEEGDPSVVGTMLGQGLISPQQVISSRNMSKAFYTKVLKAASAVGSMNPDGTPAKPFNAFAAAQQYDYVKEFNNPASKTQQGIVAGNTFLEHANDLFGVANDLQKTNIKMLNTPLNKITNAFGGDNYTRLAAARRADAGQERQQSSRVLLAVQRAGHGCGLRL
jgi:hypothetical protein